GVELLLAIYGAAGAELLLPARPVATSWATICSSSRRPPERPATRWTSLCGRKVIRDEQLPHKNLYFSVGYRLFHRKR
ncbi:hypothetical protein, partial [Pseudomonas aeruginosa]|uniref:hypothetical protein n=1 Tax=Pseudomonas aeruginosa TaxID=287 RepID=UPI001C639585